MIRSLIVAALLASASVTVSAPAQAFSLDVDKRVYKHACNRTKARGWVGRYAGSTQDFWDRHVTYSFVGCFKSRTKCKRWLSWIDPISQGPIYRRTCKRA